VSAVIGTSGPISVAPVDIDLNETVRSFWRKRLVQHHYDFYKGRHLMKLPEDLRTYQHVIEACRPEMILEFGTGFGASAVWFADQLDVLVGGGKVVTVGDHRVGEDDDLNPLHVAFHADERVTFVHGSLLDPKVVKRVHSLCRGKRVMISEDSGHTVETTSGVLDLYSDLVPAGSWFVVEDGIVDDTNGLSLWNSTGVQPSIKAFLASEKGSRFAGHNLATYGITMHINGWLEAVG